MKTWHLMRSAGLSPRIIAQKARTSAIGRAHAQTITACRAARESACNAKPSEEHMETLRIRPTRSAVTPGIMAHRIAACRAAQLALEEW
jgi:hypothetical protein